ncbi:pantetheine-phosphate adenylyltransferase [Candidatus Kinetoplastibacterium desouzaii TCC079E]|uniref:Phosphopantetheine adenylyltransferase n=1 Tax=Candidatus Kinetoplastidibacterium desouzai TCC079E TaxID=1208919 RepID=M1LR75_9PROT|nr:pantetheine-phosphate adenylyltransferase [Candidatus Kinetoplastibacterium desouzaii]AGF46661.1 pantetheine-phosphate adenylyltransferase [Candidatus Kinetoplastibacterium desouzaii TCC079E]
MIIAVYPGTFDPITKGHEDLIKRTSKLFDKILVAIASSKKKQPFFTLQERSHMAKEVLSKYSNVYVSSFDGLLKDFIEQENAQIIIRGLRAASDFEYEFQMAGMNKQLMSNIETIFMTPSDNFQYISSTIVREIAQFGGDISKFVSPSIVEGFKKNLKIKHIIH